MRTMEMFDKPRKKHERLMHVTDCGTGNCDGLSEGEELVAMRCKQCGHESGWITMPNVTAARRGIRCPHCNNKKSEMDLTIAVNKEYFDQIKAGRKTEEYRLCTPYWEKRLIGRQYNKLILTRGYPKRTDIENRIEFMWLGAKIRTITHPHFGVDPVEVYAIPLVKNGEQKS